MSNATIARRILEILDAFERGEIGPLRVEECLELHVPALEGLSRQARDEFSHLSGVLVKQNYSSEERELLGVEGESSAARDLRRAVENLL